MTDIELKSYIYRVLKQVHPDTGITSEVKESVNTLINLVFHKLVWLASDRVLLRHKKTLQADDIAFAVTFLLQNAENLESDAGKIYHPPSLLELTVKMHSQSIAKWSEGNNKKKAGGPRQDSGALAGLTFPPTRIENAIRKRSPVERVSKLAGVSVAAILETITAEILEFAGNAARDDKKVQIAAPHLHTAISNSGELSSLFAGVLLPGGYVKYTKAE